MNHTEEELADIREECFELVDVYLTENIASFPEISFVEMMVEDVHGFIFNNGLENHLWTDDDDNDLLDLITEYCMEYMNTHAIPLRQNSAKNTLFDELDTKEIESTLDWLSTIPVQTQRSPEWFAVRKNIFSASNLWKLFSTPAQYNSLIYEKCKADTAKQDGGGGQYEGDVLSPNPRNWGIKYEPVSVLIYEHKYDTEVNTKYGCIPHESLPIGASPDGINIKKNHPKYGRMVEIKNIYNRDMDGIPSPEYWIQMQIQMETCRLENCDFVETRFKEYITHQEYVDDVSHEYKGIIIFFIPSEYSEGKSHFVYVPLMTIDEDEWIRTKVSELASTHILYHVTYWYLEEMFCTNVERNYFWFRASIPTIKEGWDTVLREIKTGYEHRAPRSRKVTEKMDTSNIITVIKLE
jgi:hypothetical protein